MKSIFCRLHIIVGFFLLQGNWAYAQIASLRVSAPSPTASSLGKHGEIPVSLYTGTPNISIPLFDVRGRMLSIPISLSYHASGIKVEEIGGWVGLGWSLSAGGVITRSMKHIPDDGANGYMSVRATVEANWNNPNGNGAFVSSVLQGQMDTEPDAFFFNFAGRSGQLVYSDVGFRTIPFEKIRVEYSLGASEISQFTITTENGTKYVFGEREYTTDHVVETTGGGGPIPPDDVTFVSSWYLSQINSPEGTDQITLSYSQSTSGHSLPTYYEENKQLVNTTAPAYMTLENQSTIQAKKLSTITTGSQIVTFDASARSDVPQEFKLDSIKLKNSSGTVVKKFQFFYGGFAGDARLRLDSLRESSSDGSSLPSYAFTYNTLPLPSRLSKGIDHWGYYNGQGSNATTIPTVWFTNLFGNLFFQKGANRAPDSNYVQMGTLNKITYPTGGYSEFTYEMHDYGTISGSNVALDYREPKSAEVWAFGYVEKETTFTVGGSGLALAKLSITVVPETEGSEIPVAWCQLNGVFYSQKDTVVDLILTPGVYTLTAHSESDFAHTWLDWRELDSVKTKRAGGVRIKRIRNHDGMSASNDIVKDYQYKLANEPDRSSGDLISEPKYYYEFYQVCSCPPPGYAYLVNLSSVSRAPLGMTQGSPLGYREVTEVTISGSTTFKSIHKFRSSVERPDQLSGPAAWPFSARTSWDWQRGQLTNKEDYNSDIPAKIQRALQHAYYFDDGSSPNWKGVKALTAKVLGTIDMTSYVYFSQYQVISAWTHPTSELITQYDQSGQNPVTTTKNLNFDNTTHLQPTSTQETNSDGTQRITEFKYAHEAYAGMNDASLNKHMISQLYSTTVKKGTSDVESKKWTLWGNADGYWRPREEWLWKGDGNPNDLTAPADPGDSETFKSITYESYNIYGQLLQGKDANNTPITTKWSYNSAVPVATFVNATNAQSFIDEFGDGDYAGWTIVNTDGSDTEWSIENGMLKQINRGSASDQENDRIVYDLGTEITGDVVFEFDLRIGDSNAGNLFIAAGGDQWGGLLSTEAAVWTQIDNETWYYYSTGWNIIQSALTVGRTYHFKIVAKCATSKADYYLDGQRIISNANFYASTSGIQKIEFGNYGYGVIDVTWYIDNVRLYSEKGTAVSASYDPNSLLLNEKQDENGMQTFFEYDNFQRLARSLWSSPQILDIGKSHRM